MNEFDPSDLRAAGAVSPVSTEVLTRAQTAVHQAALHEAAKPPRRRYLQWKVTVPALATAAAITTAVLIPTLNPPTPDPPAAQPTPTQPTPTRPKPTGPLLDGPGVSCMSFSLADLRRHGFAFDGSVLAVGGQSDDGSTVDVTFQVHEWFRGGRGTTVTAKMPTPKPGVTDGFGQTFQKGTRVLISGDRFGGALTVAICGHSWYYDADSAARWRKLFA